MTSMLFESASFIQQNLLQKGKRNYNVTLRKILHHLGIKKQYYR
jgi:hypothetical protein